MQRTTVIILKSSLVGEYFIDGEPIKQVNQGQVCEMHAEHAVQAIERGLVGPYERPIPSYEVTIFAPKKMVLDIETKEADRHPKPPDPPAHPMHPVTPVVDHPATPANHGHLPDPEPPPVSAPSGPTVPEPDVPPSRIVSSSGRRRRSGSAY